MRRLLALAYLALLAVPGVTYAQTPDATPPTTAPAGDATAKATDAFTAGQQAYQAKDFASAASHFMDAYKLDPNPLYLFNAAQAYRLGNDCQRAMDAYQSFMQQVQEQKLNVSGTEQVHGYIEGLKVCVINQKKAAEPSNGLAYGLMIGGVLAGGLALSGQLEADHQHFIADKAADIGNGSGVTSANSAGNAWADVALVSVIVGGAAVATGAVLWYVHHRQGKADETEHAALGAAPLPGGAAVSATWRF